MQMSKAGGSLSLSLDDLAIERATLAVFFTDFFTRLFYRFFLSSAITFPFERPSQHVFRIGKKG